MSFSSNKRGRWSRGMSIVALAACTAAAAVAADAGPARVKLAMVMPQGSSFHQALQAMGARLKAAPDGGVALTIFTDGAMGGEADSVRRMRTGQLQAALLTASGLAEIAPDVGSLQNIPLAFESLDEFAWVHAQLTARFESAMLANGFVVLGWWDAGWLRLFSKNPLRLPLDLQGGKISISTGPAAKDMAAFVQSLGLEAVPVMPTQLRASFESGAITIMPAPPIFALTSQLFTAAPHLLELNWAPFSGGIIISKRTWDDLTPAQQELMRASAAIACRELTADARREMLESVAAMQQRGLQRHAPDREAEPQWSKFFENTRRQSRGTLVPAAMFDEIMTLIAKYRDRAPARAAADATGQP